MNRQLEILIQLQELALMLKAQEITVFHIPLRAMESFNKRVERLRHKVQGSTLSAFDRLLRNSTDAVVEFSDGLCGGCQEAVSGQTVKRLHIADELVNCPHCGRFLYLEGQAPTEI